MMRVRLTFSDGQTHEVEIACWQVLDMFQGKVIKAEVVDGKK